MAKLSKREFTILLICICIVGVIIAKFLIDYSREGLKGGAALRSKGNPKASVQIIEYIDFQCPACARGAEMLQEIMVKHPEKIYVQVKYYPLGMHKHAFIAARYGECAARQAKFWPFLDLLLKRQSAWTILDNAEPAFRQVGSEVGINPGKLDACLKEDSVDRVILEEREQGNSLGVKSTPTYFINTKMIVGTKSLTDELKKYIEAPVK